VNTQQALLFLCIYQLAVADLGEGLPPPLYFWKKKKKGREKKKKKKTQYRSFPHARGWNLEEEKILPNKNIQHSVLNDTIGQIATPGPI